MKTIFLDNFILEEYNFHNSAHKEVIYELNQDCQKYLGNLFFMIERSFQRQEINQENNFFIAYYNDDVIGIISLKVENQIYEISIGIRKKYRHQYLGTLLLQEFSEKLFEIYPHLQQLSLKIDSTNTNSIKAALLASYVHESNDMYTINRK